jgi:hypothetical protein
MTIMEGVRSWLRKCPELKGRLDVDFLDENEDTYSLDSIPGTEIVKKYLDGSTIRQYQFVIASRRLYDQDIEQNLGNLEFFEKLTEWIENKSAVKQLPVLDGGRTALKVEVTSSAYPFVVSEDGKARYQIQLRLEYFKRRK